MLLKTLHYFVVMSSKRSIVHILCYVILLYVNVVSLFLQSNFAILTLHKFTLLVYVSVYITLYYIPVRVYVVYTTIIYI